MKGMKMGGCGCDDCREYLRKQREEEEGKRRAEERANYKPTWEDRNPRLAMLFTALFCFFLAYISYVSDIACMVALSLLVGLVCLMGVLTPEQAGGGSTINDDEAMAIGVGAGIMGLGFFGGGE